MARPETRIALQLIPHAYLRPCELRRGEWKEIDYEAAVWKIPAERMKMKVPHAVPLSKQAIGLLMQLQAFDNPSKILSPPITATSPPCATARSTPRSAVSATFPKEDLVRFETMLRDIDRIVSEVEVEEFARE